MVHVNTASAGCTFIGGGDRNIACGINSSVVGGILNTASATSTFIGGGDRNIACGINSSVVGGTLNTASVLCSFIGGGCSNSISNYDATNKFDIIVGGENNTISNAYCSC